MNKVVYVGNQLQEAGLNPTTIDTLGDKLEKDIHLIRASKKANPILRLFDIWLTILKNAKSADFLLIDTYSTTAFHYAWTSAKLAKMMGLRYIPFLHGGDLPKRYNRSKKISAAYLNNAHDIVSPSNYLREATEKAFSVKSKLIPNYLELENYPFEIRVINTQLVLLWVRSFHEIYNPLMAIDVLLFLTEKRIDTRLIMVGPDKDGTMELTRKKAEKLNLISKVEFTGRLTKAEWISLSSQAHVFVNTTTADNTPVSVMEAMALGLPVVTTNVGGIPFLFENNKEGLMVDSNNHEAMGAKIMGLYSDTNWYKSISKAGRAKAESWDWKEIRKQWLDLLNSESIE